MRVGKVNKCFFLTIFLLNLLSCSDETTKDLEKKNTNFVSRKIFNAKMSMTDSAYTLIKLRTPLIEEYEFAKTPYTVFPKGIDIDFYVKGKDTPGHLKADYAKMIEMNGWYEARKNVVIVNPDKDTLKTNQIFWNKKERKIFSNDTVKIYRADGITTNISANGIEATEDFKNFKFKKNIGTLPYNDDLERKAK